MDFLLNHNEPRYKTYGRATKTGKREAPRRADLTVYAQSFRLSEFRQSEYGTVTQLLL
jgi:hypothetical protein